MASPPTSGTPAFDSLQAMVNLVLTQTGRYLKEVKSGGSSRAQFAMKRAIPAALDRFHDSLDELENEIHRAQTVMRRDLALLQADRHKREQAEAAERERLAAESSAKKNNMPKAEAFSKDISTADAQQSTPLIGTENDQIAEEAPSNSKESKPNIQPQQPASINTAATAPERDPLFDGTPNTANPQETDFDFDAMFDDSLTQSANATQPTDPSNTNINTTGDLDFNLDNEPSLLRGLEDFANSGNDTINTNQDFNMLDITTDGTTAGNPILTQEQQAGHTNTVEQPQVPEGPGVDEMLDAMSDTNMDNLFSFDYASNPEGTEFEDAFFGFGET